jgi:DNA primase
MKPDQQPKYLNTSDGEIFHKSQVVYGQDMARAAAARAGRVVLVEGYTDVIALHQAGVPETVAQMGTALTDAQINAVAKLAPKALFCQDPDRAGQESVARGIAALRGVNAERTTRGVEFRIVRLPSKQDPADVVQQQGAEAMRALLEQAVEIERFEVERALEQPDATRDDMLAMTTPLIASLPASVLREDLIQLVANRLGIRAEVVMEVLRGANPGPAPGAWEGERGWNGDRGRGGGRGGRGRDGGGWRGRDRYRPPAPPPEPVDPRAALERRERSEEAFLSYCIAMPEEGEARLAAVEIEDYFSSPATRKAAAHIRGRLRSPNANLPQGDEDLARLVAKLTVEAHRLEATPAKLELEALQLDLHRLERHISQARLSGDTSGVGALAAERLRVHEEIRHRLT